MLHKEWLTELSSLEEVYTLQPINPESPRLHEEKAVKKKIYAQRTHDRHRRVPST